MKAIIKPHLNACFVRTIVACKSINQPPQLDSRMRQKTARDKKRECTANEHRDHNCRRITDNIYNLFHCAWGKNSQLLRLKEMIEYCALDSNWTDFLISASETITDPKPRFNSKFICLCHFDWNTWERICCCLHDYHIHPNVSSPICPSYCKQSFHNQHQSHYWTSEHKLLNLHYFKLQIKD